MRHSELNPSTDEVVHFYQIWLRPARNGLETYRNRENMGMTTER